MMVSRSNVYVFAGWLIVWHLAACGAVSMPPDFEPDADLTPDAAEPDAMPQQPDAMPHSPECRVELVYLNRYETNISSSQRMLMSYFAVIVNHGAEISLNDFSLHDATATPPLESLEFVVQPSAQDHSVSSQTAFGYVGIPYNATLLMPYVTQPWTNEQPALLWLDTGNISQSTMIYAMATYLNTSVPVAIEIAHNPDLTSTTPISVAVACIMPW